jgi:hypothetical protein
MTCAFYSIVYDIVFLIERKINYFIFIFILFIIYQQLEFPETQLNQAKLGSLCGHSRLSSQLIPKGMVKEGQGKEQREKAKKTTSETGELREKAGKRGKVVWGMGKEYGEGGRREGGEG